MKFLFICLFMGLFSAAFADDYEKDERIKAEIRKELDSFFHMDFKATLCPVDDVVVGGPGIPPIPGIPYKYGGGDHHSKPKCDGAEEHGVAKIFVKGFFNLRFGYKLRIKNIKGTVTAIHIHCYVDGGDGPPAATLDMDRLRGSFKVPDLGNGCGYESFEDLYLAMKMGKTYVNIHTKEKPNGHLKGKLIGHGF